MELSTKDSPLNMDFAPTVTLTSEQVAFFHENGFLALDPITDETELARLREAYDRIFTARAGREKGDQFDLGGADEEGKEAALPQILGPTQYAPEMKQGLFRANALSIVQQLLGDAAVATGDHAIYKPAGVGAETPWHQDEAYWNPDLNYNAVSVWMPLQEATVENGCLWFVPGSQQGEVLEHQPIGGDVRVHGLEALVADTGKAVACPLKPGGVTIHANRTLHYAGPNTSGTPRRALIMMFGAGSTPRDTARRFPWNELKQTAREERAKAASKIG
ncbi:MAG: phytanoyl-CoA dioxygenase family protein [Fibrella sp.]|nr:phytanoyl-CoA dioxygenase family protein [Armatimonadota bacterium]